eukprot:UN21945
MVGPQPARYRLVVGSGQKSGRRVNMSWRAFGLPASKTSGYKISTRPDPTRRPEILTRPERTSDLPGGFYYVTVFPQGTCQHSSLEGGFIT